MDVRTALLQLRSELGMTQAELADVLGISAVTLCRWEKGNHRPSRAMSRAVLSAASSRRASSYCQNALKEALLPSPKKPEIDDLRHARLDQINRLVNDSSNAVIVSDIATHDILYVNRQMGVMTGKPIELASRMKCYAYMFGKDHPCEFCGVCGFSETAYTTGQYESPRTGRYYVSRGKLIQWDDRKAHIEYIADMTDLHQTEQELLHHRELLSLACENAQMWVFSLAIQDGILQLSPPVREALSIAEDCPTALAQLIATDSVLVQYAAQFDKALSDLRRGVPDVAIVAQTRLHSSRIHWIRFRARCIEWDAEGMPQLAVCSGQIIDEEKALQNRIQFEHEQIIGSRKDLMGYVISDITGNKIVESHSVTNQVLCISDDSTYDAAIEASVRSIVPEGDQALFAEKHQRAYLIHQFEQGVMEQNLEYQLLQPDGTRIWVHTEMKLMLHPSHGHVFLYEYCYAVHTHKILKGLLRTIIRNGYDVFGAISLANDQVARLQLSGDGELMEQELAFASYTEETRAYCEKCVVPEERKSFLQAMSLECVCKALKDKDTYRASYHELTPNEKPRVKVSEYTLCDRKYQFCLLSVWDQEVMRATINHVADATTEAVK